MIPPPHSLIPREIPPRLLPARKCPRSPACGGNRQPENALASARSLSSSAAGLASVDPTSKPASSRLKPSTPGPWPSEPSRLWRTRELARTAGGLGGLWYRYPSRSRRLVPALPDAPRLALASHGQTGAHGGSLRWRSPGPRSARSRNTWEWPQFQYIVTTTSRPPDELMGDDRVRLQLKGAPAEARLLGRDL